MTHAEFFEKCERFDWFYTMSDDSRVFQSGIDAERKLKSACTDPVCAKIFQAWTDYVHSGPVWGKPQLPKPQLSDFVGDSRDAQA